VAEKLTETLGTAFCLNKIKTNQWFVLET